MSEADLLEHCHEKKLEKWFNLEDFRILVNFKSFKILNAQTHKDIKKPLSTIHETSTGHPELLS